MASKASDVKDLSLADQGRRRIEWALQEMPVLRSLMERFHRERPLEGVHLSGCLHITTETANLARVLTAGGAKLVLTASNPLSTQDDAAAALVQHYDIPTYAIKGESSELYYQHLHAALDHHPQITMDDGCDLVSVLHTRHRDLLDNVIGGTEETTTGVIRLRAMAEEGALRFPVMAVNDAMTKHMFDNRYGTGQSTLDGLIRATNLLLAGRMLVVCGYGWCGRGLASRAHGMGAHVIVTEVDPTRALEALMDGYRVMPLAKAVTKADVIITVTGDLNVVDAQHFRTMKNGCIVANSGHFNDEINIPALLALARSHRQVRPFVQESELVQGRR